MEYIIASICIVGVIAGIICWDYNRVKDTQEFKDIEAEIEREDRLDDFRKNRNL